MHEILTIGGLTFLLMNGTFVFFMFRFIEKLFDPKEEEKLFKKMKPFRNNSPKQKKQH